MESRSLRKPVRIAAIILLFIVALNAMAAGYSFIFEPSGRGLGFTTDYLKSSAPFHDYFVPGIILFVMIGVFSLFTAVMITMNKKNHPSFLLLQGCILIGWIAVQLTMVKSFHPLHLIIASIGAILIAIGFFLRR